MRTSAILVLLVACDAGSKPPPPHTPISNTQPATPLDPTLDPTPDPTNDVITAALLRVKADPTSLPDHGLVGSNVYVMIEPGTAKPPLPPPFVAMTHVELDAEADRIHNGVGFVHIFGVEVKGDVATITIGGDVALPAANRAHKLCCCESTDEWNRKAGAWTFGGSKMSICS
jgi:hypothetical protein